MNIDELLLRNEGKTLEFKRDLSSPAGVLKTLVAFANTSGGRLLLGVEDQTKAVLGVPDPLAMEETLASKISDSITPKLVPDIEVLRWRNRHVVAVVVHPSPNRPHHISKEGPDKGTYVRVGSTNRRADADLAEEMRRHTRSQCFDEMPMPELDTKTIDFQAASKCFAAIRALKKTDLTTLRLQTRHQGRTVPTVGGTLLFGRERLEHFPDAWIQAGRFAGTDKANIQDHVELKGYPVTAIEEAIAFVEKHSERGATIGSTTRTDRWTFPPVALREAVVNAVVHADYSQKGAPIRIAIYDDRLEIENPGLLLPGLTIEDLRDGVSRLRNRVIGRVFKELGLIEQWGSGVQRMISACEEAGINPPDLEEVGFGFRVTFHKRLNGGAPKLDPTDQAIVDCLADGKGRTTAEIARRIDRTPRTARARLAALIERGLVRENGTGAHDPKRKYYLAKR